MFAYNQKGEPDPNAIMSVDMSDFEPPWTLTRVHRNQLSPVQKLYARVFYWAAFVGDTQLCKMFLKKLGLSPFMKLFKN